MVCHICGKPASMKCYRCDRFACSGHSPEDQGACSCCIEKAVKEREEKERENEKRKCVFCGKICGGFIGGIRTHSCYVCHRYFCDDHGQRVEVNYRPTMTCYQWQRCLDHPIKNRKGKIVLGSQYQKYVGGLDWVMGERLEYSIDNPDSIGSYQVDD